MSYFQAIVMGIIQGVGEFLPISSSGHLVLAPWLFEWQTPGLAFDVALHMGTLLAVAAYFWRDWLNLFLGAITGKSAYYRRQFGFLVVGSLPAVVAVLLFKDFLENVRSPLVVATMLIVFAGLLFWADRRPQVRELDEMTIADALLIGAAQAIALIPGVSRSGITMTAGRSLFYRREEAARFSFLLSTPVIFGAGLFELPHMTMGDVDGPFIAGIISSAVMGLLAISFLMGFLKKFGFKAFAIYRVVLGGIIILMCVLRG